MAKYRHTLPQVGDQLFLTDGGIETTLVFHEGVDLPYFAAFHLLASAAGRQKLAGYFRGYAGLARQRGVGMVLETPTWRANADWGRLLGYSDEQLADANRQAVDMLVGIRTGYETERSRIVVSGCVGPRGDGYKPAFVMSAADAESYHTPQVETFAASEADMVCAITMTYAEEAIGIARAAHAAGVPAAVSFTVETDGRLPDGQTLGEAIGAVDAATGAYPAYYMINCAHPTHFDATLRATEPWVRRLRGLRANASTMSHAELDQATELDDGDPVDLGRRYRRLRDEFAQLTVLGGCCGTDQRHVAAIHDACVGF